ncbi:MAG: B12-binding domain-containing radical SAM protein [Candidatus Helarchaeota archaeon]
MNSHKFGDLKIVKILIIDALRSEKGTKRFTRDFIGSGPRIIAGILEKHGIYTKIDYPENIEYNKFSDIDFLFISAMSIDLRAVKKIIKKWKRFSNLPVLIGGPITSNPLALKNLKFDIAFTGESEESLERIIKYGLKEGNLPQISVLEKVKGIFYRINNDLIINEDNTYISKELLNKYQPSIERIIDYPHFFISRVYIECVRGCSNFKRPKIKLGEIKCNNCGACQGDLDKRIICPLGILPGCGFCSVPSVYGPPRSRYIKNIVNEIKGLIEKGVRRFVLGGSDFLDYERDDLVKPLPLTDPYWPPPNIKKIEKLLSEISSISKYQDKKVYFFIENIKACLFSREIAEIISKYLPNTTVSLGCESGSTEYLKSIGKPSSVENMIDTVRICKEFGIRTHCYFIHGLPNQNIKVLKETLKFMKKVDEIGIDKITIYRFKPLPKSSFENFNYKKNKISEQIKKLAIRINYNHKLALIDKRFQVIIAEKHKMNSLDGIGYILEGGPTVLIKNGGKLIGQEFIVKINRVLSDKFVEGEIIEKKQ